MNQQQTLNNDYSERLTSPQNHEDGSPLRARTITQPFDKVEVVVPEVTYKSFQTFLSMALILAISSFEFGYALCEISTVPITKLMKYYDIHMDPGAANGLLVGIMPFGGIFGCIINRLFLYLFSRKYFITYRRNAHFAVASLNLLAAALVQINTIETIVIGRFVLGICCGLYTAIAPQYIKDIAPPALRPMLGSFISLGRVAGIVFCYALGVIFSQTGVRGYYRIIFAFPGGLAIFQSFLILFFVPDSPVEMLEKHKLQSLQTYVETYYVPDAVDFVFKEYQAEFSAQQSSQNTEAAKADPYYVDPLSGNKRRAFLMAIYLNIYRQFLGVNTLVAFAGQFVPSTSHISPYVDLILNSVQAVFTIVSTFWLGNMFGRRPLYLVSGVQLAICNILIMLGFLIKVPILAYVFMILYMALFGLFYAPVSWSYPAEIIPAANNTFATAFTWAALTLTTLIPPIVNEKVGSPYPLFAFFGVYTAISVVYMYTSMVESKGRKYFDIIRQF